MPSVDANKQKDFKHECQFEEDHLRTQAIDAQCKKTFEDPTKVSELVGDYCNANQDRWSLWDTLITDIAKQIPGTKKSMDAITKYQTFVNKIIREDSTRVVDLKRADHEF